MQLLEEKCNRKKTFHLEMATENIVVSSLKLTCHLWTCNMNINTFWLMFWNISILINPEYSLEGLILKLKLQYFGHLMQRANSLEKTLMLWKIEGRRRRGHRDWNGWMASLTQWSWVWVNSGRWWWTGRHGVLWFMGSQRVGHNWVTELNRTERVHIMGYHSSTNQMFCWLTTFIMKVIHLKFFVFSCT